MSSAAQANTNRENAAHSTGPRTEEGKNRSKLNATTHGLASNQTVLPWENREQFQSLCTSFEESYDPQSSLEIDMVNRMAECWWRLERANRVESQFLLQREQAISAQPDGLTGDAAIASMFTDPKESARMRLMMRYVGAAQRAWARACSDFQKARKERLERESELAFLEAAEEAAQTAQSPALRPGPEENFGLPPLPGFRLIERNGVIVPIQSDSEIPAGAIAAQAY